MNPFADENSLVHAKFMNSETTREQQCHQHLPWLSFSTQLSKAEETATQYDPISVESTVTTPIPLNYMENSQSNPHVLSDYECILLEEFAENLKREKCSFVGALPDYTPSYCGDSFTTKTAMKMSWRVGVPSPFSNHENASNFGPQTLDEDISDSTPPLKALSAYNFFFRYTRDRLLSGNENEDLIYSSNMQELLLNSHWYRDRSQKRRHRKSHGKIDFATLSRMVSQRWKSLPEDGKNFFKEIARKDLQRYRKEQFYQPSFSSILNRRC